jgi:hypothetical protein
MAHHHFKIVAPAHGRMTSIEMDGEPLRGVRSVRVDTAVDEATTVTLEFVNITVEIEARDATMIVETTEFGADSRTYGVPI